MAENPEVQELNVSTFLRMLFAKKELTNDDVANAIGKSRDNVATTVSKGRPNVSTLIKLMEVCGEPFVLRLKSGELIKIKLTDKK